MRLHEYQTKGLFARYGIPVITGELVQSAEGARTVSERLTFPIVINAQVLADQRLFRTADSPVLAEKIAQEMLNSRVEGYAVHSLLIEQATPVKREYSIVIAFDRAASTVTLSASDLNNKRTFMETIDPLVGIHIYQARYLATAIDLPSSHWSQFVSIILNLYRCYEECDAVRATLLPLAMTAEDKLVALGGKIDIDDNALFRHPELAGLRDLSAEDDFPSQLIHERVRVMRLPGNIACFANGAGLAMATADGVVKHQPKLSPGTVIEIEGEVTTERLKAAFCYLPAHTRGILLNFFCERFSAISVADNLRNLFMLAPPLVPCLIRLGGLDEEIARDRLAMNSVNVAPVATLAQAIEALSQRIPFEGQWQS